MDRTDEALIVAHRQGDETAFAELVRRHGDCVLGYLMRMTADQQRAEDLFQETFKKVHQKAGTFRAGGPFRSWLFSIASNVAIDELRRRGRKPRTVSLDSPADCDGSDGLCPSAVADSSHNPVHQAVLSEQRARVAAAVGALPPRQRAVLVLAYYENLTYREIADVVGCSVGAVKTHMFRALKALAGRLPELQGGVE